jgi:catechol-2,3-dioxygenase
LDSQDWNTFCNCYSDDLIVLWPGQPPTIEIEAANFSSASSYHHHISTKTWLGNDVANADSRQPSFDHFALNYLIISHILMDNHIVNNG